MTSLSFAHRRVYAAADKLSTGACTSSIIDELREVLERINELNPMFDEENGRLMLFVDFLELSESAPKIVRLLLDRPDDFLSEFMQVFYEIACSNRELFKDSRVWIRPVNVSAILAVQSQHQNTVDHAVGQAHTHLQLIAGRVVSLEAPFMKVWSRTVKCSAPSCESGGRPFRTLMRSNHSSVADAATSISCQFCNAQCLSEDRAGVSAYPARYTTISVHTCTRDKQQIKPPCRILSVLLQDDLAEEQNLALGAQIQVLGYLEAPTKRPSKHGTASCEVYFTPLEFVAWNVFPDSGAAMLRSRTASLASIQDLARADPAVRFSDAVLDVRSIMDLILPALPAFGRLKLMVLLTMLAASPFAPSSTMESAEAARKNRTRLHLLVHGGCHRLASAVVREVDDFTPAETSWISNVDGGILPKIATNGGATKLEASELTLALGGVACFGNIQALHKSVDVNALRSVLDAQDLVIGKDSAATVVACKVSVLGIVSDQESFSNWKGSELVRHFDLVHDMKEEPSDDFDILLSSFLLGDNNNDAESSTSDSTQELASLRHRMLRAAMLVADFKEGSEAYELVSSFFHASRQALAYGAAGGNHYDLSSLCRIARTVAQLRLQAEVDIFDAVLAINLTEETRAAKGRSNIELYSHDEVEAYSRFHRRIVSLCQAHGTLRRDMPG